MGIEDGQTLQSASLIEGNLTAMERGMTPGNFLRFLA
jgi:hypothetical protein